MRMNFRNEFYNLMKIKYFPPSGLSVYRTKNEYNDWGDAE